MTVNDQGPLQKPLIAPSLLSADFSKLEDEAKKIEAAGYSWLHLDIMDGAFVPNLTFGMPVIAALRKKTKLFFDTHLMIEQPENYILQFVEAGSDLITIHIESTQKTAEIFAQLEALKVKKGITLRPGTSLSAIEPYLSRVDLVLVMTVEPGFGGQGFMQDQVLKIEKLQKLRAEKNLSYLIEVDGGINPKTIAQAKGADVFVAGSFVFGSADYASAHQQLMQGLGF